MKDTMILKDGSIVELEDALEMGQEVLIGAVSDLGTATSAISEQLEGGEA